MVATPDEQLQNTVRFGELSMKLAAVTLVSAAVFAPQSVAHADRPTATVAGVEVPLTPLPDTATTECPAPTPQAMQAAKKLLAQPLSKLDMTQAQSYHNVLARHIGVTLPNIPQGSLDDLYFYTAGQRPSFDTYFAKARDLFKQDDITLRYATKADFPDDPHWKEHIPVPAELENDTAKSDVLHTISTLFTTPKEYFAFSGLKQVIITRNLGAAGDALTGGANNTIRLDLGTTFKGDGILDHETGHLVQTKQCGNPDAVMNDPTFTRLNGSVPYKNTSPKYDIQSFDAIDQNGSKRTMPNVLTHDYRTLAMAREAWKKNCDAYDAWIAEAKKTVFTDEYAASDKAEDEAQVLAQMTRSASLDLFHPEFPVLNQKGTLELARLLQYGQVKTATYLVKVMRLAGTIRSDYSVPTVCVAPEDQREKRIKQLYNYIHPRSEERNK